MVNDSVPNDVLKAIAELTRDLTEMRLHNSPSLCIENFAPELFSRLLLVYQQPERFQMDAEWFQMATGTPASTNSN